MKTLYLTGILPDTPVSNQYGVTRTTLETGNKYYPLTAYGDVGRYLATREKGSRISISVKKVERPDFTEYVVKAFDTLPPVRRPSDQVLVKLWARAAFQLNKGLRGGTLYIAVRDYCEIWGDPPDPGFLWIAYFERLEKLAQPNTPLNNGGYDFLAYEVKRMLDLLTDTKQN